jgi:hypothetical protein
LNVQVVEMTFRELEAQGHARGETVLGYYNLRIRDTDSVFKYEAPDKPVLNPPKDDKISIDPDRTRIVVISPFEN